MPWFLLTGWWSQSILWSTDVLLSPILHAHIQYLLWEAGGSDYRLLGDWQPAVQTQHVSCIFSPVSPSLIIFFPGVAALPVSVKPKYFLAKEKLF